ASTTRRMMMDRLIVFAPPAERTGGHSTPTSARGGAASGLQETLRFEESEVARRAGLGSFLEQLAKRRSALRRDVASNRLVDQPASVALGREAVQQAESVRGQGDVHALACRGCRLAHDFRLRARTAQRRWSGTPAPRPRRRARLRAKG